MRHDYSFLIFTTLNYVVLAMNVAENFKTINILRLKEEIRLQQHASNTANKQYGNVEIQRF